MLAGVLGFALLYDRVMPLLSAFFSDNGRFELWQSGIESFLSSPVFGMGFYGIKFTEETFVTAEFLPTMAHNTVVQLLGCMGLFGFLCYLFYRIATVIPFVKRPSVEKSFIGMSVLVLLLESLLDNFIFYFLPTLQYTVALAAVFAVCDFEKTAEKEKSEEEPSTDENTEIHEPETAL